MMNSDMAKVLILSENFVYCGLDILHQRVYGSFSWLADFHPEVLVCVLPLECWDGIVTVGW